MRRWLQVCGQAYLQVHPKDGEEGPSDWEEVCGHAQGWLDSKSEKKKEKEELLAVSWQ
jgi:hypothetical protein